ncbi:MAG: hypothetical protein ACREJU_12175, partial [Nitrospiraceae bacterium]
QNRETAKAKSQIKRLPIKVDEFRKTYVSACIRSCARDRPSGPSLNADVPFVIRAAMAKPMRSALNQRRTHRRLVAVPYPEDSTHGDTFHHKLYRLVFAVSYIESAHPLYKNTKTLYYGGDKK